MQGFKWNKFIVLILIGLLACPLFVRAAEHAEEEMLSYEDLNDAGRVFGVSSYSREDIALKESYPQSSIVYFDDNIAGFNAVRIGKIDAFVFEKEQLEAALKEGFAGVAVLPETLPNHPDVGFMVRSESNVNSISSVQGSFRERLKNTFFTAENSALFQRGITTTLLVTLLSILGGTLLGFLFFIAGRKGNRIVVFLTDALTHLVGWLPVVVLLLIFYYVVFRHSHLSGAVISIITFSLTFGATVYDICCNCIATVNKGQIEAAFSMGYTERRAFYRILFPQMLRPFMPQYRSAVTELVKATSVVGFIAVSDLTNVGTIVQNRTYEAILPLLAVAIIYFLMIALLRLLLLRLGERVDPRNRDRRQVLKGVELHD